MTNGRIDDMQARLNNDKFAGLTNVVPSIDGKRVITSAGNEMK
jgi:hypothetical protein